MARKKTTNQTNFNEFKDIGENTSISDFSTIFNNFFMEKYGSFVAPPPIITPTKIRHLDALLGGGIASSSPVMISSTPETGKTTVAFQFSKTFLETYPDSIVVYIDVEGSSNNLDSSDFQMSRIKVFNLDRTRFMYKPLKMPLEKVFELINDVIDAKKRYEEKIKKNVNLLIVWDSLASTPDSRIYSAEDPNKMIGKRAATISFLFNKNSHVFTFNQVTFIIIDQVRAYFKIDPYSPSEQSVGVFKDFRSATGILTLLHTTTQWLYLSKKASITAGKDGIDVSGWYLDITSEKNKHAPSKITITCVFDKVNGIDPFWSEYHFLQHPTPTEEKIGLSFPTVIKTSGPFSYIEFKDPKTGETYTSEKFYKSKAKKLYLENKEFQQMFDYVVELSVEMRIKNGIFKIQNEIISDEEEIEEEQPILSI